MVLNEEIAEYAGQLFDVVGSNRLSGADSVLILGLESKQERNLDEFGRLDGHFKMYGFEKHVGSKLEKLLNFIRGKGFSAELIGRYGYPLAGEINLKGEVIIAGLGRRGKNTVVLHPKYGPRLRFMAIVTNAPLEPPVNPTLIEGETPVCSGCSICIDACPVRILEPYRMTDPSLCLSDSDNMLEEQGKLFPCDKCLKQCPAGRKK